jgi:nucleotide-binding universal stress UspA family protein
MKILIAVDDSKYSEAAVQAVLKLFHPPMTEVKVLHVLAPISVSTPPQMASGYAPELEDQGKAARALVEGYAQKLRAAGFQAEAAVERGDIREKIIDSATHWRAEVIFLGSHGRRGMGRLLLGSVAESVVRHAPCSVQVVRPSVGS